MVLGRCATLGPLGLPLGASVYVYVLGGGDQAPVLKLEGAARLSRPDDQVSKTEPVH